MADIGLPQIDIIFRGLGVSAVQRGSKGLAVLIIKDDTDKTFTLKRYKSIADITSTEEALYTEENVRYIKDCLEGTPKELVVARMDATMGSITDLLGEIKGQVEMNCWIGIADSTAEDTEALISFIKSENKNSKKRYKGLVFNAIASDDMHIVNFTNQNVKFADVRGTQTGEKAIPFLLGFLAGLSLDMSAIAFKLQKFESVEEPSDIEAAINSGEFVLMNDEGDVGVARAVNSLITTGQGITDDMKFILIVEVMDLIYTDIHTTWKNHYKGKYKNYLDNQMLLIGAINSYLSTLSNETLLDPNFKNTSGINVEKQRLANIPIHGEEKVSGWSDEEVMNMTVSTNVFLKGNIKILNATEDFEFIISM